MAQNSNLKMKPAVPAQGESVADEPAHAGTREEILAAALRIFTRFGYQGASMRAVVEESGFSKPTIYAHFGSKEQLFSAIIQNVCNKLEPPDLPQLTGADLRNVLTNLAESYRRSLLNPAFIELYRLILSEAGRFPDLGEAFYRHGPQSSRKALATFLEQLKTAGLMPNIDDPAIAAEHFEALILDPIKLRRFLRPGQPIREERMIQFTDAGVEAFLRAYGPV